MDQPTLQGGGGCLGTVGYSELAEDVINVTLYSRFADTEAGADFFIALALHDQLQHFHLSAGQIRAGHSLDKPLGNGGRNVTRSAVHGPNRRLKLLEEHVLQQIASGSCLQRSVDVFITIVGSEDDHARVREFAPNSSNGFDSTEDWHTQINERHRWFVLAI